MRRILIIARTEFLGLVRTKAFFIGILMVPVLIGISIAFQAFASRQTDVEDHPFAVIDETGVLYGAVQSAAAAHNAAAAPGGEREGPHYLPEQAQPGPAGLDALRAELSDRVRAGTLFAFVELPATLVATHRTDADPLRYYTQTPSYAGLPNWIRATVNREVTARRFAEAGVDAAVVEQLTRATTVTTLGLVTRGPDGAVVEARRVNRAQVIFFPLAMMALLFFAVMSTAPPLLTTVVEEKASRISEVLLAAVPPFHLMAGKLLGVSAVSVLLALLYIAGGVYLLIQAGQAEMVRLPLLAWFVAFLLLAVLMYGSIFIMIGSAATSLEDSQTLMQPVMLFLSLPVVASTVIIQAPGSTLAVVLSLVPTATPFVMLTRLAMTPAPPLWQVVVAVCLTGATAALCVFAAGRILRIGLLMQGKPPNLPELLRWIRK